MTRPEAIAKLLTSKHLDAPERAALGVPEITLKEIASVIQEILQTHQYFPPDQSPWQPGTSVYEGFIIEKLVNGQYRFYRQRAHPLAPWQLAESKVTQHRKLDPILKEFLRWEWARGIDGIIIKPGSLWNQLISNFK